MWEECLASNTVTSEGLADLCTLVSTQRFIDDEGLSTLELLCDHLSETNHPQQPEDGHLALRQRVVEALRAVALALPPREALLVLPRALAGADLATRTAIAATVSVMDLKGNKRAAQDASQVLALAGREACVAAAAAALAAVAEDGPSEDQGGERRTLGPVAILGEAVAEALEARGCTGHVRAACLGAALDPAANDELAEGIAWALALVRK